MNRLEIPFVLNADNESCGQACVQGILRYFNARQIPSLTDLKILTGSDNSSWTLMPELALGLNEAGLRTEYAADPDAQQADADSREAALQNGIDSTRCDQGIAQAKQQGVHRDFQYSPDALRSVIDEGKPIICLIDYVKLLQRSRPHYRHAYLGHFVTVTGFDENEFIIHQPGLGSAAENLRINADLFCDAHTALGAAGDTAVVHQWKS